MRHWWLVLILLPLLATAEIYRWTDAKGTLNYGERPPAGAQKVDVRPQAIERDAATQAREERTERFFGARREEQAKKAVEAQQKQSSRSERCRALRGNLGALNSGRRLYYRDDKGERVFYSDEQLNTARRKIDARLAADCA
ncbi:DUF4124 domain-containing protein [Pseudomonas sp. PS02288]|uniref:DUF4124 domain-containing protein n=1 Tax=Pseudomonas sp. PS02288 TaxID=2991443 RepID=UPI00249C79AD|nr:DUF4124 domain-containing protein [Pseudomonas sp. PS02288]